MGSKGKKELKWGIIFAFFALHYWGIMALDPDQSVHQYVLEEWKTTDGLADNSIFSIAQTPDGYMWFATYKDLVRFDGVKFSTIRYRNKKNKESKNKKTRLLDILYVDKKGTLWIGGIGHLTNYRYQTGQFTSFTQKNGLTGKRIYVINEDMKGNLWLGFMGCDMSLFVNGEFTRLKISGHREGQWVTSILEDRKGNLLVGTYKNKVFKFQDGNFLKYEIEGLEHDVQKLYQDREGILWIGTNNGLYRVVNNKVTDVYTTRDGLSNNDILDFLKDSDGNLWLGTLKGLTRMRKGPSGKIVFETLLENHIVPRLFEDREKNLWIATDEEGIKRLKNAKFVDFAAEGKYKKEVIYSLFEDHRGDIWLGAHSGKLLRYGNGKFIESLEIPGISGSCIYTVTEDHNGDLWLGTNKNGAFKKKGNTNTFINFTTREGLAHNYVITITTDSKNNVWFGTYDGVSRYRNGKFESVKNRDGLLAKNVYSIYEDKNHHIWIATAKGINVIKNGELTSSNNMSEYLKDIPVTSIYGENTPAYREKNDQVLWIGTYGSGLRRFKDGTFTSYTEKDGLSSNYIYRVFADDWGNFWMSSQKGTLRISKSQLEAFAKGQVDRIHCTSFDTSDGMISTHFYNTLSQSSAIKTRDGELLFVTKKGITMVHPGKIKINRIPPPVIIEDFFFKGSDRYSYNGLHPGTIAFKGMNHIGFHFTSPTFLSPEKIKFKYKLEGHDKDWAFLAPGANRVALYEDLAPGTYIFKVAACSGAGIWNNTGDSMAFTINTCFQNSTSFKLLLLLGGLVLVATAVFLSKKYPLARNGKVKYNNSHLNHVYVKECIKKLDYSMEIEKIYRDENISLHSLSGKLSITPHQLSRIINENLNKNFPDFINTYRVEEAKKILADPKQTHRKILTIAFDVGFNTKVAFNTAFKKHTNMTPSEFRKNGRK